MTVAPVAPLATFNDREGRRTARRAQTSVTFKKAPRAVAKGPEKRRLAFDAPEGDESDVEQPF